MKLRYRIPLLSLSGAAALVLVGIVVNQFDAPAPKKDYSLADLAPARISPANGYYHLFTLHEPAGADPCSLEVQQRVNSVFDPARMGQPDYIPFSQKNATPYRDPFEKRDEDFVNSAVQAKSLVEFCRIHRAEMMDVLARYGFLLARYDRAAACSSVDDFSQFHPFSPVLSLLNTKRIGRLADARAVLVALDGDWDRSLQQLGRNISLGKRLMKHSRIIITYLIGLVITNQSCESMADLLSDKGFPPELQQTACTLAGKTTYDDVDPRNACLGEYLFFKAAVTRHWKQYQEALSMGTPNPEAGFWRATLRFLTFQRNRTVGYFRQRVDRALGSMRVRVLKARPWTMPREDSGWFWWLNNAYGKSLVDQAGPSFDGLADAIASAIALSDLTRLSAQIHARFDVRTPPAEVVSFLAAEGSRDPFTGQPYRFDVEKQVLSTGPVADPTGGPPAEPVQVPCVLFLRLAPAVK